MLKCLLILKKIKLKIILLFKYLITIVREKTILTLRSFNRKNSKEYENFSAIILI